jgi:Uncharacterized alpha/beta hydrolase domain (DUF2235)
MNRFLCVYFSVLRYLAAICNEITYTFPSAYELYADLKNESKKRTMQFKEDDLEVSAEAFFKKTFSRKDVKVHFLGAWCV